MIGDPASPILARAAITPAGRTGAVAVTVADDGTIAAIEPTSGAVPDRILVPGFVDLQVNGIDDVDVAGAANPADWDRLADLLLAQGTTSWCPTLISSPLRTYAGALERVAAARAAAAATPDRPRPTIIGAHLEGPFLGTVPGAHRPEFIVDLDLEWLAALPDVVALVTLGASRPGAPAAIRALRDRGVAVSIGHDAPSAAAFTAAVDAGAAMVTHLFNGMSGTHHRDPGLAAFALTEPGVATGIIADLIHVHPRMVRLAFAAQPAGSVVLVTDATAWRAGTAGELRISLRDGAPRLADGTLAGSCLTMDAAVRNCVRHAGVTLETAVAAATSSPARVVGLTDRGELRVGGRADIVALDDELGVAEVFVAGRRAR